MSLPTLLVKGSIKSSPDKVPIDVITGFVKSKMPEFGYHSATLNDRILIIEAKTGSGKSTVIPTNVFRIVRSEHTSKDIKYSRKSVICTQPRVLTAVNTALDLSDPKGHYPDMVLGETIGYQTKDLSNKPSNGLIFATLGLLAAQIKQMGDNFIFDKYFCIMIDEVHERSIDSDMLLLLLKHIYHKNIGNEKLPFLFLMSATFSPKKYADYFGVSYNNIISVEGNTFKKIPHWPQTGSNDYITSMVETALEIHKNKDLPGKCDIMIFVPGMGEIKKITEQLRGAQKDKTEDLYIVLNIERTVIINQGMDYQLTFVAPDKLPPNVVRRIIVGTNTMETGLTVPTLKYVIDSGWYRGTEYYFPHNVNGLITKPAAKSQLQQRWGRVGRLFDGHFYPMYTEKTFKELEEQQLPEIITNGVEKIYLTLLNEVLSESKANDASESLLKTSFDLLDDPPLDSLMYSNAMSKILGFSNHFQLTELGKFASKFSLITMEQIKVLLSAFVWNVSMNDLITIITFFNKRTTELFDKKESRKKNAGEDILFAALPRYTLKGSSQSDKVDHAKNLYKCDFITQLLIINKVIKDYEESIEDFVSKSTEELTETLGINPEAVRAFLIERDSIINELITMGIDIYYGNNMQLSLAKDLESFMAIVVNIKKCLYDGLKCKLLVKNLDEFYYSYQGLKIPKKGYTQKFLITDSFKFTNADRVGDIQPLLYKISYNLVSVMDDYVDVDEEFCKPKFL